MMKTNTSREAAVNRSAQSAVASTCTRLNRRTGSRAQSNARATALALSLAGALVGAGLARPAQAQDAAPADAAPADAAPADAAPADAAGARVSSAPASVASLTPEQQAQGASLIREAIGLAEAESTRGFSRTRLSVVRGAASLLPLLEPSVREQLVSRWMRLAMAGGVSREVRLGAFSDFFDAASRRDGEFARRVAGRLTGDDAARAGAYITLSERSEGYSWKTANDYALRAQAAARQEGVPQIRARALAFVALRMATLNPELRPASVVEASRAVRRLRGGRERDYLLAEVAGAAAKFDIPTARRIGASIGDERLRNLALARSNLSEISQTTLSATTQDRVAALAKAAARYDVRAIPILLQLPPQSDVLRALSDSLPPLYPTASSSVPVSTLERLWNFSQGAEPSVYKDQLQSRLARQMILHDLWRGRAWGKQLAWKGGRVQAGTFLNQVARARSSALSSRASSLQDLADRNIARALLEARSLRPEARAEALLLLAGQVLT